MACAPYFESNAHNNSWLDRAAKEEFSQLVANFNRRFAEYAFEVEQERLDLLMRIAELERKIETPIFQVT